MRSYMPVVLAIFIPILLLLVPEPLEVLFSFVLVGLIPFTNVTLPPIVMLVIYALLLSLVVRWALNQSKIAVDPKKRQVAQRQKARQYVAKRNSTRKSTSKTSVSSKTTPRKRQTKRAEA